MGTLDSWALAIRPLLPFCAPQGNDGCAQFATTSLVADEGEQAQLTITLSRPAPTTVRVGYRTHDGSASAADYTPVWSGVTFAPGETRKQVSIPLAADGVAEPDEHFTVALVARSDVLFGATSQVTVTIRSDPAAPEPTPSPTPAATPTATATATRTSTATASPGPRAAAVVAGDQHSCAIVDTGRVRCWGRNDSGQLGDSSTTNRLTPVAVLGLGT